MFRYEVIKLISYLFESPLGAWAAPWTPDPINLPADTVIHAGRICPCVRRAPSPTHDKKNEKSSQLVIFDSMKSILATAHHFQPKQSN